MKGKKYQLHLLLDDYSYNQLLQLQKRYNESKTNLISILLNKEYKGLFERVNNEKDKFKEV